MKKLFCLIVALCMLMSSSAFALNYQQHFTHEATFETLEEARANAPAVLNALTGNTYVPDPALDTYPEGTTYVYRSANMYTSGSAAYRMNTNILVYTDKAIDGKDAALSYLKELGLTDIIDEACGSVVLVTPANKAAFAQADQYAYFQLQAAMCNLGFSVKDADENTLYYADNTYYGGLTYRYLIGIDGGASFIHNYIATTLEDVSRVAGMLLIGGKQEDVYKVAGVVPAYLVNTTEKTVAKYIAANAADACGFEGDTVYYYNQNCDQQCVAVASADVIDSKLISDVYYGFLVKAMRCPALKSGLTNANMLYSNYNFNQTPYALGKRDAIINGKTVDGIVLKEVRSDIFSDITMPNGNYLDVWYEFLPEEVLNNTAPAGSVPLWLANHGGGDDPVQFVDEIGLLDLAGQERFAIVSPEQQSIDNFGPNVRADVLPKLVQYMLDTYPALDASRVYTTGYSMGGGATLSSVCGNPGLYAAAIPMAAVAYRANEVEEARFADTDLPVMFMTSSYDYFYNWTTFEMTSNAVCDYPNQINDYLRYNNMDAITFDFAQYPLSGFKGDSYNEYTVNNEYRTHIWKLNNAKGVPMVALGVTESLTHSLYPEYAKIAWNFAKHYSRDQETGAVVYNPYVR